MRPIPRFRTRDHSAPDAAAFVGAGAADPGGRGRRCRHFGGGRCRHSDRRLGAGARNFDRRRFGRRRCGGPRFGRRRFSASGLRPGATEPASQCAPASLPAGRRGDRGFTAIETGTAPAIGEPPLRPAGIPGCPEGPTSAEGVADVERTAAADAEAADREEAREHDEQRHREHDPVPLHRRVWTADAHAEPAVAEARRPYRAWSS